MKLVLFEGKTVLYQTDEDYAMKVKQMMALAFVPEADVIEVYEKLTSSDPFINDAANVDVLIDYFDDNYMGRVRRGRRGQPRFPIRLWNQYERVVNDLPRTNNATEGWHNAFNSMVSVAHPTAGRLARKLQQEQHSSAIKRNQLQTGQAHPKKSKTYQRVDAAIKTIVAQYSSEDQLTYLRNIARVVNINVT